MNIGTPVQGQRYHRVIASRSYDCKNNCDINPGDSYLRAFHPNSRTPVEGQPIYCKECAFPDRLTSDTGGRNPMSGDDFGLEFNYTALPALDHYDGNVPNEGARL